MRENLKHREELTEGIKEAASTLLEDVEKLGKVTREAGQERFREVESQFEGFVRKYPMRIVFLAAGAGFLLGFLKRNHR